MKRIKFWYLLFFCCFFSSNSDACPVQSFGHFSQMVQEDDASGHFPLSSIQSDSHLYGLGPLAHLAGEIIIIDGDVFISSAHNNGQVIAREPEHQAAFLALAQVTEWHAVTIEQPLTKPQFEAMIKTQAKAMGLSMDKAFPFLVKGHYANLTWHVVTSLVPRLQRIAGQHANKQFFNEAQALGTFVGFYTGQQLSGVISHPKKPFHIHYLNQHKTQAGHVDDYQILSGTTLFLPKS